MLGWFWLRESHEVAVKTLTWAVSEALLGWRISRACSFTGPLPRGPPPTVLPPMSSTGSYIREQGGRSNGFYDLASAVTSHLSCTMLLATQTGPDTMSQYSACCLTILHSFQNDLCTIRTSQRLSVFFRVKIKLLSKHTKTAGGPASGQSSHHDCL